MVASATFVPISDPERLFPLLIGNIPARIWIKDADGRYVFVNDRLANELDIDRESWIGSTDDELFPAAGHIYWRKDLQVLTSHEPLISTDQIDQQKYMFVLRFPLTIDDRPHVVGIGIETTEQVSALIGIFRLRDEAFRNERLRAIGEMASGVAHDLRNNLHSAALRLSLLRAKVGENLLHEVDGLTRSLTAASDRVSALQEFVNARTQETMQTIRPSQLVREAVEMVGYLIEKTPTPNGAMIKLDCKVPESVPLVVGPPNQLKHVISNLLLNARDAMPDGGTLSIDAIETSSAIEIVVADEGSGIDADALEKIFEPFFTTKEFGNGLGLSMARDVMSRVRGKISAANRSPQGAAFTLTFPLVSSSDITAPDTSAQTS
jgi:signal transduction histidine kinase